MNKKQILESLWDYLIERLSENPKTIPSKPGQHLIIEFKMHMNYGPTSKTFLKAVKKHENQILDDLANEMLKEFNNNDDSTDGN